MMLASPLAGRLAIRYSVRSLATAGVLASAAGLLTLAPTLSATMPYPVLGVTLFVIGAGSGLFLTPNTSSIMANVPAERRGIANGVRSMLQNTGFVVSTALTLAIITSPLTAPGKRAAYGGTLSQLPGTHLDRFVDGCRVALIVLFVLCLLGAVASSLRPIRD